MLPLALDVASWPVILAGGGEAAGKRLTLLDEAGTAELRVFSPDPALIVRAAGRSVPRLPTADEIAGARILFVAGVPDEEAAGLAAIARAHRVLVNVEDVLPLCDFHVPSIVRRGDLLMTVSTGGRSPAMASMLRQHLAARFGPDWEARLDEVAALRTRLREGGASYGEVLAATRAHIAEQPWLCRACPQIGS